MKQTALDAGDRAPGGLGRFGNGKAVGEPAIPTFIVHVNGHDASYLNLVYELFTEYGPLDEVCLGGANLWTDHAPTPLNGTVLRAALALAVDGLYSFRT
ncbi:hypothetical protein OG785_04250 [Streptomyces sp. NBC_00006]|uniref:hypothetical protein n=1 Tax=Streptomyces sp. NBC_00006 TaxID=2975619 RepID=UPI00224C9CAB|nr:hypothetical protein [Streptomyces sp. NBC_00006]MCX5529773.1 hypothetical protein [Streptomyces sp. NBC_00006]